jgi:hypothetical protein
MREEEKRGGNQQAAAAAKQAEAESGREQMHASFYLQPQLAV